MAKKSIQQSVRIPRDLYEAGTVRLIELRKITTRVSMTDVIMTWARRGAIAEGVKLAEVAEPAGVGS